MTADTGPRSVSEQQLLLPFAAPTDPPDLFVPDALTVPAVAEEIFDDVEVLSLFSGPGGWCEALRVVAPELHDRHLGVELDERTCATRIAAGHRTLRADVRTLDPARFPRVRGLIGSPPCQSFSNGGRQTGRGEEPLRHILDTHLCFAEGCGCAHETLPEDLDGDVRTALVVEPIRWIAALADTLDWVLLEQVPAVLPVWEDLAEELIIAGWDFAEAAVLDAADFGAPQHRRRAVLFAVQRYPKHYKDPYDWAQPTTTRHLTPADVLGLHGRLGFPRRNDRPDGGTYRARDMRSTDQPAFTLTEKVRSWRFESDHGDTRPLTLAEIATLQSFRADYPVTGSRTAACLQIANAVPPALAAHLLATILGHQEPSFGELTAPVPGERHLVPAAG
jgi:DNA (cytosine-5)-methyltransferase 1